MKLTIDTDAATLTMDEAGALRVLDLYTDESFELLSRQWMRVGWNQKYAYSFTWLGRPVIQFPEDLIRAQEVVFAVRPDVIVETGIAHGGSLIFYASLLRMLGGGRVIGVDIEIRPHNRRAIEEHPFSNTITLIEGSSTAPETVERVRSLVGPDEKVMVVLDSCHTRSHVLDELEAYASLVTAGSYIVATDGIMYDLHDVPRGRADWADDNPAAAARQFASAHPEFALEQPQWLFNESTLSRNITCWPDAWLRRK